MKIFSRKQIYEADQITVKKENLPSINLMERAGGYIYEWVHERLKGGQVPIKVFCGIGNNGGDGMVLARYLIENNYNVTTYLVNYNTKRVPDFLEAYSRLKSATKNWPIVINEGDELPVISPQDIVVDAIFGIGLNRVVQDWVKALFTAINASNAYVLSIDIPSGMYMDMAPQEGDVIIQPRFTLSFQAPKLPFFLPMTAPIMQAWDILDIGLDPEYLATTPTDVELIGKQEVIQMYRSRGQFGHKGMYGHSLLIGGSYGKMGAIVLASKAAMRAGSGMVTAYVPQIGVPILQTAIPEVMTETDNFNGKVFEEIDFQTDANAIGIGPGMGTDPKTAKAMEAFLKAQKNPIVIDADAINIIAANPALLAEVPALSIVTPHMGELARLIGTWEDDFDRLEKTAKFAKKHDIAIVMKGAHTITTYDMKLYINDSGNPGLATAGSGDVLTGVITGLLAQGYHPMEAALMGVYFHGRAADIAINQYGIEGLMASDVTEFLGRAYMDLFAKPEQPPQQQEG
ncbi:NAD(P)H-hydrate dehydratase [uncultured Dokdonia sp.]|uniref:NAD(P)H-hydrate dehydratase n=1 Tax=uncultured Dokdonia sp. TaxID=575653 RepID=UPI00260253EE|nr:NAD(P)H-hydrate dehydratase [uncultured Dokdonia sp.]